MSKLHTVNGDNPRSCVMQVASAVGQLCHLAIDHFPSLQNGQQVPRLSRESYLLVMECITELLTILQITATAFNIPLLLSVQKKLALNNLKYPAKLCKGSVQKWTVYSDISRVSTENQWIDIKGEDQEKKVPIKGKLSELVGSIVDFTEARQWSQFDVPRNLILALVGEVGELAELVQWEGDEDVKKSWNPPDQQRNKLAQEIADICIYVLKLANALGMVQDIEEIMSTSLF